MPGPPYDAIARERIVWTDVYRLDYSGVAFSINFPFKLFLFNFNEGRMKIIDDSAYISGMYTLYIMRRTRPSLTSRTSHFLPRDAMHKRGLCRHAMSVCLSVCHVHELRQNE